MDHITTVLGAIYPDGKDAFLWARDRISSEYFAVNQHAQRLWDFTELFVNKFNVMPSPAVMKDSIEKATDAGTATLLLHVYYAACNASVPVGDFKYAVDCLVDDNQKFKTGEIIATAYEILEQGYSVDGEKLQGHAQAREFIAARLASLEKNMLQSAAVEGNVLSEAEQILADYENAKSSEEGAAIPTGFPSVDKIIGGMRAGDLTLIAAYASMGKSALCVDLSYKAAIEHGKGVFYATTETARSQIRSRFLARHSRAPQFNCPGGLDHSQISRGALNSKHEQVLRDVLEDLGSNPNYGKFHIAQLPTKPSLAYVEQRMLREQQSWNIDLLTIDSLNLLRPDERRNSRNEELTNILIAAKNLCTGYNGSGVSLLSPWQINRNGFEKAKISQSYDLNDLAEAAEAERSADFIFSLYYDDQQSNKNATFQALKTRGTAKPPRLNLDVDYRNSYFSEGSKAAPSSLDAFGSPSLTSLGIS